MVEIPPSCRGSGTKAAPTACGGGGTMEVAVPTTCEARGVETSTTWEG